MVKDTFKTIIRHLIGSNSESLAMVNITEQFNPADLNDKTPACNLNAAFLILLSGEKHPLFEQAVTFLDSLSNDQQWGDIARFYKQGPESIYAEIEDHCSQEQEFKDKLVSLSNLLEAPDSESGRMEIIEKIREVFFPEGLDICNKKDEKIQELREKRKISILKPNPDPVTDASHDILFTSNVLLTIPSSGTPIETLPLSEDMKSRINEIMKEEQLHWFDHPVQIGVDIEKNEAVYGLKGLDEAVKFEQELGTLQHEARLDCVLSVSTTHAGLQLVAKQYLEEELKKGGSLNHVNVLIFTEKDTRSIIETILIPAAHRYFPETNIDPLMEVFGVDGEYGRHYSFLKAIAAFWQVFVDPNIKGTFKIDLDQVFPQEELAKHTAGPAFQHLTTPLWGAEGKDSQENDIELGMIAGSLVNERDIRTSLFTPDVCFPPEIIKGDELIFYSPLPQALSTEAEMMTSYSDDTIDGKTSGIQRIHVTGGTCGILVKSLRKYRPFTPTFIGRAEDQAYILSVLFRDDGKNLRYVHKDGLIMRHDKEAFAQEAIKAASLGKLVGDYTRILWFSYYARALPWPVAQIKDLIDPFTGCFVSPLPFTIVYLRMALKAALLFAQGTAEQERQGTELVRMGAHRLSGVMGTLQKEPNPLIEAYRREKQGWDIYYEILDRVERDLRKGNTSALALREKAQRIIHDCRLNC